jgi:hypothetical protein
MKMHKLLYGAAVIAASGCCSFSAQAEMRGAVASAYKPALVAEGRSRALCESKPGRIFVPTSSGSECVAYWVTKGFESRPQAVFYMGGDLMPEEANDPRKVAALIPKQLTAMQRQANTYRVRYVKLARLGTEGSSGNHGNHGSVHELAVTYEAINVLKKRLGIKTIALAGQSGGSNLGAGLLTVGRTDIACAMLGSGGFNVVDRQYSFLLERGIRGSKAKIAEILYDPSAHVDGVADAPGRRVFIIGDPKDQTVPFKYQAPFGEALRAANHHAATVKVSTLIDPARHNTIFYSFPAAGACLNGASDKEIVSTIGRVQQQVRAASQQAAMHPDASTRNE